MKLLPIFGCMVMMSVLFSSGPKNMIITHKTADTLPITLDSYDFMPPDKWMVQKTKEYFVLTQSPNPGEGCIIHVFVPQPSSGDLEKDAVSLWEIMYPGWEYQKTGENMFTALKGFTPQGLEYYMIEAPMKKIRADGYYYDYENGKAVVIKAGEKVAVIAGRHDRLKECHCERKYELWQRMFNSFTIKDQRVKKIEKGETEKQILGVWQVFQTSGIGEYAFAANGQYKQDGSIGSMWSTSDQYYEYIHFKASSFQGDGSYAINGKELILKKRGTNSPERMQFRIGKVNKGGKGWIDRLYLLKNTSIGVFEVTYDRIK